MSQGPAAELAKLMHAEFPDELRRRKVSACQSTAEELQEEIHGDVGPGRSGRISAKLHR